MGVEGRDLIDLGKRKLHLGGKRGKMRGRQMPIPILDQMQVFDQQVPLARAIAEQRTHLIERGRIDLAPFGGASRPTTAAAVRFGAICLGIRKGCRAHSSVSMSL